MEVLSPKKRIAAECLDFHLVYRKKTPGSLVGYNVWTSDPSCRTFLLFFLFLEEEGYTVTQS